MWAISWGNLAILFAPAGTIKYYSGTLIIGSLLGRAKTGQISKVVTLSRCCGCILWSRWQMIVWQRFCEPCQTKNCKLVSSIIVFARHCWPLGPFIEYKQTKMGQSKSGLISKVVWLSGWSHSKVPLYLLSGGKDRYSFQAVSAHHWTLFLGTKGYQSKVNMGRHNVLNFHAIQSPWLSLVLNLPQDSWAEIPWFRDFSHYTKALTPKTLDS